MPEQLKVVCCDDCPLKIETFTPGVWTCPYGSVDVRGTKVPADCDLHTGGVLVTPVVRR